MFKIISSETLKNKYKLIYKELVKRKISSKRIYVFSDIFVDFNLDLSSIKNNSLLIFNNLKDINILESSDFSKFKNLKITYFFKNSKVNYLHYFISKNLNYNSDIILNNSTSRVTTLFFDSNKLNYFQNIYIYNKSKYYRNDLVFLENSENKIKIKAIHNSKNTISNITTRNILKKNSFLIYDGLIDITKNAELSEGNLEANTIMLSKDAKSIVIPKLEIIPKKVKASHSAANESISKDTLFFLESKGIPKNKSKKIIISSFLKKYISKYPSFLKNFIYEKIDDKL